MSEMAGPQLRAGSEQMSELDHLCWRLEILGATPDEIGDVRATWDTFDEDWSPADQRAMATKTDTELLQQIQSIRDEYPYEPPRHDPGPLETNPPGPVVGALDLQRADYGPLELHGPDGRVTTAGQAGVSPGRSATAQGQIDLATAGVRTTLKWVGRSPERARQAYDAEQAAIAAGREPRNSLLERLTVTMRA